MLEKSNSGFEFWAFFYVYVYVDVDVDVDVDEKVDAPPFVEEVIIVFLFVYLCHSVSDSFIQIGIIHSDSDSDLDSDASECLSKQSAIWNYIYLCPGLQQGLCPLACMQGLCSMSTSVLQAWLR